MSSNGESACPVDDPRAKLRPSDRPLEFYISTRRRSVLRPTASLLFRGSVLLAFYSDSVKKRLIHEISIVLDFRPVSPPAICCGIL